VTGAGVGSTRRADGIRLHAEIGRATDGLRVAETRGRTLRIAGWVLVLIAAGLALSLFVPRAWAAGGGVLSQPTDSSRDAMVMIGVILAGILAVIVGNRLGGEPAGCVMSWVWKRLAGQPGLWRRTIRNLAR
jgi:hypothetical protein